MLRYAAVLLVLFLGVLAPTVVGGVPKTIVIEEFGTVY